jgi:GntR family transcriptional regulator / MocR family aminotransferase
VPRSLRRESPASAFLPQVDRTSQVPVGRQLYLHLRDAIISGSLVAGFRLPSTRAAATEWCLARGVVAEAYEMLIAEGYALARHGSGTYVAPNLHPLLPIPGRGSVTSPRRGLRPVSPVAEEAKRMRPNIAAPSQSAFATGRVVHDARTARLLARIASRHLDFGRDCSGDAQGLPQLRAAIAMHLAASRGVRCEADQVFVTAGTQQALDLVARTLVAPERCVVVEDPCYPPARQVLALNGARLVGLPVDGDGMMTARLWQLKAQPVAIYVTPSHQYPAGSALPLARRLELLAYAREAGCWIIEDDFDSEFRYEGRPVTALQGLDRDDCVLYLGSFSKSLLPSLRVGYLIAPPELVATFKAIRPMLDRFAPRFQQKVIADFMNEGYFPAHLRRLRENYRVSRDMLVGHLRERLSDDLILEVPPQGIHLTARSTGSWRNDVALTETARRKGVVVIPISPMYLTSSAQDRLMLGFSGLSEEEADAGTQRLAAAFMEFVSRASRKT